MKRQLQKTPISEGSEMNADVVPFQWVSKHLLNEDKASERNYAKAKLILHLISIILSNMSFFTSIV